MQVHDVSKIALVAFMNELGKIFNNALCFLLLETFVSFVFLTKLMMVWPNYLRMLPTLIT